MERHVLTRGSPAPQLGGTSHRSERAGLARLVMVWVAVSCAVGPLLSVATRESRTMVQGSTGERPLHETCVALTTTHHPLLRGVSAASRPLLGLVRPRQ